MLLPHGPGQGAKGALFHGLCCPAHDQLQVWDQLHLQVLTECLQGIEYPGDSAWILGPWGDGGQCTVKIVQENREDVRSMVGDLRMDELRELSQHVESIVPDRRELVPDP
eukprot:TRINITY_DN1215_c1_g1_i1.p1 TRINITY_DN1215_c1_g1~~TRINITY_DN1215_c1_g1_i1.p1  ORF type:complete len:110 (-),score=28.89 TRINITY_DN1215_c1_g1_i1:240-569(-)